MFANSANNTVEPERWIYVVATYDKEDGAKIYVDGKLVQLQQDAPKGNLTPNDFPLRIGHRQLSPHFLGGLIDEVAIFSRALSEEEVLEVTNEGLGESVTVVEPAGKLATTWSNIKSR